MNTHLDIISLIDSDFYKKNQRLSWHLDHKEYNKLSWDIINLLNNINFEKNENEVFQIVKRDIATGLSQYLSHVYDYILLSRKNIKPIYSKSSNIYIEPIWQKRPITTTFDLDLQKRRIKKNMVKSLYSKLVKNIYKNFFKFIITSQNELSKDFQKTIQFKYLKILPQYYFPVNLIKNKLSENLSGKISFFIFSMINENYFDLNNDHKRSIKYIIETYLARASNDLKAYDGFFKKTKNIITGTGNSYYNRLVSNLAKKHDSVIWRFNHGGERCFFSDDFFWENEFFQTDYYVTYGKKWGDYLKKILKKNDKSVPIKTIGSRYNKKIFNLYFDKKINNPKKILYISSSFVSEARQFPNNKLIDPVLYDWQRYLIETIHNLRFDTIYKMHPKGFFQEINNLGLISKTKTTATMFESLKYTEKVIIDSPGTALIESLCAGKDIIYIDMKQRLFNKENLSEFNSVVKIIPTYISDGILYLDETELKKALNSSHKNIEKQKKLIEDYILN